MSVSRRSLLLGAGAVAVAGAAGAAVEAPRLRRLLASDPRHTVPSGPPGEVITGSFRSRAMRTTIGWSVAYPDGSRTDAELPVLAVLHGRGDDHRDAFASHRLDAFLSEAVRTGTPPFAVASVDGGDHSYWHARRSGEDPQTMLLDELLPLLARRGLETGRFGLAGWSMGGYGALLLAERLGPERVAVVAVDGPAIWRRWEDTAAGAFDSEADFLTHDVLRRAARLRGLPIRVTCGTADPFVDGVRALLREVPHAERELAEGDHNLAWWQHAAPAQLAFAGRHLTR